MTFYRSTLVLGVALSAITAGVSAAQPTDVTNPEAVTAWLDDNAIRSETSAGRWLTIGADGAGVYMQTVVSPKNAQGVAGVALRVENYAAAPDNNALSQRLVVDLNCTDPNLPLRPSNYFAYAAHNLENEIVNESMAGGEWAPKENFPFTPDFLSGVCAIEVPSTTGPGAEYVNDFDAGVRWLRANGVNDSAGGSSYSVVGFDYNYAVYYRNGFDAIDRVSRTVPRVVLRFERFEPTTSGGTTVLSEARDFDLNCSTRVFRPVRITRYPLHNLSGQGVREETPGEWAPAAEHPILRGAVNDICEQIGVDAGNITGTLRGR
jgi:hypothetical protein